MASGSFMEKIIQGVLDKEVFRAFTVPPKYPLRYDDFDVKK